MQIKYREFYVAADRDGYKYKTQLTTMAFAADLTTWWRTNTTTCWKNTVLSCCASGTSTTKYKLIPEAIPNTTTTAQSISDPQWETIQCLSIDSRRFLSATPLPLGTQVRWGLPLKLYLLMLSSIDPIQSYSSTLQRMNKIPTRMRIQWELQLETFVQPWNN